MFTSLRNEFGEVIRALQKMNDNLQHIVCDVRGGIDNIDHASNDIAEGNANISAQREE